MMLLDSPANKTFFWAEIVACEGVVEIIGHVFFSQGLDLKFQ